MRRILILSFVTFAGLLLAGCPKGNQDFKAAQKAELTGDLDTALVSYDKALKSDPLNAEFKLRAMRARFNDGQHHVELGEKALKSGQLELALSEFQKAEAIDPSSAIAEQEAQKTLELIGKTKAAEEPKPTGVAPPEESELMSAPPELKPLSREPINLNSTNTANFIFDAIGKLAGISVIYNPDFAANASRRITVQLSNVTLEQALDAVALQTKSFWKPVTGNIILIAPDDVQHRHDLEDEEVQTFYLHNNVTQQDLTEMTNLLRTVLDIQRIQQINSQNAIVIRTTPDKLMLADKIIRDVDKAKPEVVIQVDVLQASMDRLHDLGILPGQSAVLQFTPGSALQPSNGSSSSSSSSTANQVTLGNIRHLSANDWSATLPGAALTAIMTDTTTKVIQNPVVRVTEGATAKLHIGDRVPYAQGSFQTGGVGVGGAGVVSPLVNTQFQFIDVGVKMELTPRVHPDGDISMKVDIDVSSVTRTVNIGGVDQPVIGEKTSSADIRLKDGESSILGGLVDQETTKILNGWPGVAHIPFLKYFFSDNHRESTDTEVLIALTPHVVRMPNITADDLRTIAAGTDTNVRVYSKDENTAPPPPPAQTQGQTATPGASATAGNAPGTGGASLQFQPDTVSLKTGDTMTVGLAVSNAQDLFSIPLLLQYNPAVIQVTDIRNGGFLSGGTEDIAVVHQENQQQGQSVVSATRQPNTPGISGSGTLLGIVIKAIAPGTSQLQIVQVNARDSQQRPISLSTGSATIRVQ
ncbi:MAG TPA: cohesin domain-containing protein [Candidatus Acidoferrales bacterium]|nr:cohesin domain-containing protein [Candidatus Acidoferrales bacterium]